MKDILADNNILLNSDCGGHGICGKCKVYIKNYIHDDISDPSAKDICSCRFFPKEDMIIQIPRESLLYSNIITESGSSISSNIQSTVVNDNISYDGACSTGNGELYAAVDLGSTTISVSLLKNDSILDTDTFFNPTIRYGSDIISRQQAQQSDGKAEEFAKLLKVSLSEALYRITSKNHCSTEAVKAVYISGNTTMQHFLFGHDTNALSSYPFKAEHLSYEQCILNGMCIRIIPSFSTFIGGDIISGLYYIESALETNIRKPYLFLDLGTNAEMVIATKTGYICTSAAAGPAFEGTNISCGCAAVPGAIMSVKITESHKRSACQNTGSYNVSYKTIGNKLPVGICGSGILSLYAQLIKNHILDETGTFSDEYIDSGFPVAKTQNGMLIISQKDIRELQLAVAAIKTGVQILLGKSGLSLNDLTDIYISGSFGKSLEVETIQGIDLLPDIRTGSYADKIIFSGNTSLMGAQRALSDTDHEKKISSILSACHEIHMADYPDFNNMFLANI